MKQALIRNSLAFAAALSFVSLVCSFAHAQSTAFTYQGSLDDAGAPANGLHDFRFRLFDAASGGAQIGSTLCVDNVTVTAGVFTAQLDFGQQYATIAQRHLEIEVRRDTGLTCGDATGFVMLSPRQQLTATPLASHANSAFSLDAADGSPTNAVFVDNGGNVGLGSTSPAALLHLQGTAPVMLLQDTASPSNQAGYVSFWNNASTETAWMGYGTTGSPQFSVVNARTNGDLRLYTGTGGDINLTPGTGGDVNLVGGNVGVGTFTPTAKLDVRGDVTLGASGEYFAVKSPANDRSVRGAILSTGAIDATRSSPGFTVSHSSTGVYSINFTVPFTSPPTVVVSATAICCRARVTTTATGSAFVHVLAYAGDALTDSPFHFIAMGP